MKINNSLFGNLLFQFLLVLSLICITQSVQGATLYVPSSQYPTIQSAVNAANSGDIIILQAGITFTEQVILKYKSGNDYITIQSSALANLPPPGQRVNPTHSQYMPKITPPNGFNSAISTEITANGPSHHYRLLGIEVAQTNPSQYIDTLITLGSGESDQNTLTKVAHHFIIDRCYIHGLPNGQVKRGIGLNSLYTDIVNSYFEEIHVVGADSQAIGGWNGPGQFLIENNYLEAATENVIFGGADPQITNLVPSDIVIRHNFFTKKLAWLSQNWSIKNLFELKNARRVNIEKNIFSNNWAQSQSGIAILFTVRNQNGTAPWSTIEDVNFHYNLVSNTPSSITFLAQDDTFPSQNVKNISIKYNQLLSYTSFPINPDATNGKCIQLVGGGPGTQNLTVEHNTCVGFGNYPAFLYGDSDSSIKAPNLIVKNNIAMATQTGSDAGIDGNGQPGGTLALNAMTGNTWFLQKNVLMLPNGNSTYPNTSPNLNFYVTNSNSVGFVDFVGGNYALNPNSIYRNQGTDSTDPGANIQLLNQIKPCIESGNWTSCSNNTQQAIVFNGINQFANVQLPNTTPFNSLGGFQIIWRVRNPASNNGRLLSIEGVGPVIPSGSNYVFYDERNNVNLSVTPNNFSDSICKLQFDPLNSRWTFETWNANGTGYVFNTVSVSNVSNYNLGNASIGFGANAYGTNFFTQQKIDYWGWIQRVEPLQNFPSNSLPTGVNYLLKYEFEGNGVDTSGRNLNLNLANSPLFENTPQTGGTSQQAVVFNGINQFANVTLPNSTPFNSLGGFQIIWRVRNPAANNGRLLSIEGIGPIIPTGSSYIFYDERSNSNLSVTPANYSDSVCKLQYDPANSRWTFETWKSDGTGYVFNTIPITNVSNYNLGNASIGFGANAYGTNFFTQQKIDYWGWIQRVEALGANNFPGTSLPNGVTYFLRYEFENNGNDTSGRGLNLNLVNNPTFENTP